ncbi:ribonuclease VapC [Candidatus Bathyarchaeota archaeon]|nr:ribonuclease VapC [Candidatus Bathyarchaeota archaeon]
MKNSTEKTSKRVIVLDTSAFLAGFDPFSISEEQYTVPTVREEIFGDSMPQVRFKTAIESGKLEVRSPKKAFLRQIKTSANEVGDAFFLSKTDIQVLALAQELKAQGHSPLIVTDDYSIQNVADQLHIKFASLATLGIRFRLQWVRYCPACYRKYSANYKSCKCKICGTELKRKPLGKKLLRS